MAQWTDVHCHLADPRPGFDPDRAIEEAQRAGVARFLQGGIHPADWQRQFELAARFPGHVFCACGLHPVWVAEASESDISTGLQALEEQLQDSYAHPGSVLQALPQHPRRGRRAPAQLLGREARPEVRFPDGQPRMHGLGELGLDARPAYRDSLPKQEQAFRAQLRLARRFDAPLILHIVREHSLALRVLREEGVPARGGIVHSFSGGAREAQAYVELGLLLSVSGGNFRGGDRRVRQAAARVPADSWLVETDSPDQKHPDWPGEWSMPARLVDVATRLGAVLERGAEDVLASSTEQVRRVFGV